MSAPMPGRSGKRKMNADINVVPYIDVMLVLLIIFMVTAPLLTQGVDVELPQADTSSLSMDNEPLTLTVMRSGQYTLNQGPKKGDPMSPDEIRDFLSTSAVSREPEKIVLVEGDAKVPYEFVARAMALLQQSGIKKIGFVTDPIQMPEGK